MIPLYDDIPTRKVAIVTKTLIAVNVAIFLMCAFMPEDELEAFVFRYGLIPAKIFKPSAVASFYYWKFGAIVPHEYSLRESFMPFFTCMFLHGGWIHVIGNMWMLWIFGNNVEDCLGHAGFLVFYLICGLASSLAQTIVGPLSPVPTIGASGAVAGVMGAYLVLYPGARVLTLVPIIFFIDFWPIPAFLFLFYWFLIQVISGMTTLGNALEGGVAWWAHIGGFLLGASFIWLTGIRAEQRPRRTYVPDAIGPMGYRRRRPPYRSEDEDE